MSTESKTEIVKKDVFHQFESASTLRIPIMGHTLQDGIKKRARVAAFSLLASHAERPYVYAPLEGVISDITQEYIELQHEKKTDPNDAFDDIAGTSHDFSALSSLHGAQLRSELQKLGVSCCNIPEQARLLIVNGFAPEPGICYQDFLLRDRRETLEAGLSVLSRLCNAESMLLCVSDQEQTCLEGIENKVLALEYPQNLDPLLIKHVTGQEDPEGVFVLPLLDLFYLGHVAASGLPLTIALVSVQGENVLTFQGAMAEDLFSFLDTSPKGDAVVVLGGAMRGFALASLRYGIGAYDQSLFWCAKEQYAPLEDNPCISCGRCVKVCPMRLRPNLLSRYAEFALYEDCQKEYLASCIECGVCAFVCPALRPMQQYFFDAKMALGLASQQMLAKKHGIYKNAFGGEKHAY